MRTIPFTLAAAPALREAEVAHTFAERSRGLIGRTGLPPERGMIIERCNAVHTLFMRFPIDLVFLDRDGRPVRIVRGVRPWRPLVWGGWRARRTLELAAGSVR